MVSQASFPLAEDRKYSDRQAIYYSPQHERRGSGYSYADSSVGNMSDRDGGDYQQRKRIAVACGRCRKRKIRCSGDNGTGEPCTNCRNANHDPCRFLRVSSTETPMMRTGESFPYPLDASRQFQARSSSMFHPINPPVPSNYVEGMPMAAGPDGLQYRNGSAFGYGGRQYYPMQGFANGYPEQTAAVEYIGYPASYQSVQDPNYMVNCRMGANTPQAREDPGTPYVQPKPEPGTPLYVDTDAASYGYVPSSAAPSMAARQPSSAESGSFSFQNVAAGLSNSLDSGDRMLPTPASVRRPLPTAAPRSYRAASVSSSGHSKNSQRSNDGTSPPSPTNGSGGNYGPYSSSPADSYHANPLNTLNSGMSRGNELYTTAGSEMVQGSDNGVRMSGGGNMTYQYHDTTTRRGTASQPHGMALGGSQSYLSQNPGHSSGPFMMAGTETSQGPTDGNERKPLGGVRSYPYEIKPLVFGDKPEWK